MRTVNRPGTGLTCGEGSDILSKPSAASLHQMKQDPQRRRGR